MSRYRGKDGHQHTMSRMHEAVLIQLHKAHEKEVIPYRVWCEEPINLGAPRFSWMVIGYEAFTTPDLGFKPNVGPWFLAIYIDGYYHQSAIRRKRDLEIDQRLDQRNIGSLRLRYKKYSKGRAKRFAEMVIDMVKKHG